MSDFGQDYKIVARKQHRCEWCYEPILKAELHIQYKGMYDNEWQNWRMHKECFEAYQAYASYSNEWEFFPGEGERPKWESSQP